MVGDGYGIFQEQTVNRSKETLGFRVGNSGKKGWKSQWKSCSYSLTNHKDNSDNLQNLCRFSKLTKGHKGTEMN